MQVWDSMSILADVDAEVAFFCCLFFPFASTPAKK